ncbi:glycosyl transferase, group 1 family protein [Euzebya pacifica]|uniref:Glycosyl transferase, group 1 family protein n=1 Tax=Euzebya pacifica TaxID=1608957 RepID=A0A346XW20_9ACTN|nr:glycosyl transferase, group 1 family protein [Euzebya pacifica]
MMMGWGSYEPELLRIADEVDPDRRHVRFIPGAPHAELREWTAGASLGVIPYENVCLNHWFCSPNKLWEYPTAGVPILASPYPVLRDIVIGNEIGVLLDDPATPQGIANAVAALKPEALETMRCNAAEFIEQDNWAKYEARLLSLYDSLESPSYVGAYTTAGSS